jgi:gluconolactonase
MTINTRFLFSFFLLILTMTFVPLDGVIGSQEGSGLIAPGTMIKKVQSGFNFTEGPAADAEGDVYFTDIPAERIYKWSWRDGSISLYREKTGQANGLMFDQKGRLVICEMGNNRVTIDDMKGTITVIADNYHGKNLNSPNDLWIDSRGGIYFSDWIRKQRSEYTHEEGLQIYYISPDCKSLIRVTNDLIGPNGLIGAPNGKILYVTDPADRKTWVYNIQPDGMLYDKRLFCAQGSDGMAIDEKNNVYLTGDSSITVYNSEGDRIEEIIMPERPANMTFAGKDRKTLFITGRTTVYTLDMAVRGAPSPLEQAQD